MTHRRIVIIGNTGAGKTTLAKHLATHYGIPHLELDSLHWLEGWTPNPVFQEAVKETLLGFGASWVVCGNYSKVADLTLGQADTAVWLDYGLPTLLWRLHWRTWRRALSREVLWNGNQESLRTHLFTRDSLYLWVVKTHRSRRQRYNNLNVDYPTLRVVRLQTPAEARAWLEALPSAKESG